eukprot:631346-Rhodomonas_salina.2
MPLEYPAQQPESSSGVVGSSAPQPLRSSSPLGVLDDLARHVTRHVRCILQAGVLLPPACLGLVLS